MMDAQTQAEILEDWRRLDLPGLIGHPDGTKDFQPRWDPEQTAELMRLRRLGMKYAQIGKKLGKTAFACRGKWLRETRA